MNMMCNNTRRSLVVFHYSIEIKASLLVCQVEKRTDAVMI